MDAYEYDFSKSPNTQCAAAEKRDPPHCVCLNCGDPKVKVFLNGEIQGYGIFAAEGNQNGIFVQWKPMEDGNYRWSVMTGKVEIKSE